MANLSHGCFTYIPIGCRIFNQSIEIQRILKCKSKTSLILMVVQRIEDGWRYQGPPDRIFGPWIIILGSFGPEIWFLWNLLPQVI